MRPSLLVLVPLLAIAAIEACALLPPGLVEDGPASPPVATPSVALPEAAACPVSLPGGGPPVPDPYYLDESAYGNGRLWVGLWPDGIIVATPDQVEPDGTIGMKIPWYRLATGRLTISGRRLDGAAPAASADVPDGYGDRGFQPSGIHFPTVGCWQITGRVGEESLTFVTFVVKAAA